MTSNVKTAKSSRRLKMPCMFRDGASFPLTNDFGLERTCDKRRGRRTALENHHQELMLTVQLEGKLDIDEGLRIALDALTLIYHFQVRTSSSGLRMLRCQAQN